MPLGMISAAAAILAFAGGSRAASPSGSLCTSVSGSSQAAAPVAYATAGRYTPSPREVVACVEQQPLLGAELSHWFSIAETANKHLTKSQRKPPATSLSEAMDFLLKARWYMGEASDEHITVSSAQISRAFEKTKREEFANERDFNTFLKITGQTVADLRYRFRLQLLVTALSARFGLTGASAQSRLDRRLRAKWKPLTSCRPGYTVADDCGQVLRSG